MSDIVERLREGEAESVDEWWFVMAEAANEIERLRKENEQLRDAYDTDALTISYNLGYTCGKDIAKDEIEKLHREAAIRLDQIEREQEAHLKTIADFNKQAEMNGRLLTENAELREALKPFAYYASQIPNDVSDTASASGTVGDLRAAAAAIRESEAKP